MVNMFHTLLQTYAFIKNDLFLLILRIKKTVKNNKKLYGDIIHYRKFKVSTLCDFGDIKVLNVCRILWTPCICP